MADGNQPAPESPPLRVKMEVYCGDKPDAKGGLFGCGALIGTFYDKVADKYPFWCSSCEETTSGKYPWTLYATIEQGVPADEVR